jgi:hypothetical protein
LNSPTPLDSKTKVNIASSIAPIWAPVKASSIKQNLPSPTRQPVSSAPVTQSLEASAKSASIFGQPKKTLGGTENSMREIDHGSTDSPVDNIKPLFRSLKDEIRASKLDFQPTQANAPTHTDNTEHKNTAEEDENEKTLAVSATIKAKSSFIEQDVYAKNLPSSTENTLFPPATTTTAVTKAEAPAPKVKEPLSYEGAKDSNLKPPVVTPKSFLARVDPDEEQSKDSVSNFDTSEQKHQQQQPEKDDDTIHSLDSAKTPGSVKVPLNDDSSESIFGFARLPAKEPLTKKSFGRISRGKSLLDLKTPKSTAESSALPDSVESENRSSINSLDSWRKSIVKHLKPVEDHESGLKPQDTSPELGTSEFGKRDHLLLDSTSNKSTSSLILPMEREASSRSLHNQLANFPNKSAIYSSIDESPDKEDVLLESPLKHTSKPDSHGLMSATFGAFRKAKKLFFDNDKAGSKSLKFDTPSKSNIPLKSPSKSNAANEDSFNRPNVKSPTTVSTNKSAVRPPSPVKNDVFSRLTAPTKSSTARAMPSTSRQGNYPDMKPDTRPPSRFGTPSRQGMRGDESPSRQGRAKESPSRLGNYESGMKSPPLGSKARMPTSPTLDVKSQASKMLPLASDAPKATTAKGKPSPTSKPGEWREGMPRTSTLRGARKNPFEDALATSKSALVSRQLTKDANDKGKSASNKNFSAATKLDSYTAKNPVKINVNSSSNISSSKTGNQMSVKSTLSAHKEKLNSVTQSFYTRGQGTTKENIARVGSSHSRGSSASSNSIRESEVPKILKRNLLQEEDNKTKRKSDAAFGSNAADTGEGGDASSKEGPPAKKSSLGPPSNLLRHAITKKASSNFTNIPQVDAVKFSSDKLRFSISNSNSNNSLNMLIQPPKFGSKNRQPSIASVLSKSTSTSSIHSASSFYTNSTNSKQHFNLNGIAQTPMGKTRSVSQFMTPGNPRTELPEIFSESEDDAEGSVLLEWANSPELRATLLQQQRVDPDTVFGPVAPLQMEEVFHKSASSKGAKFRPRSSSANWSGQDKLSQKEIDNYAKEMGYK